MSFNKRILPEKSVLVKYLEENGSRDFYWRWVKSIDAFMGPSKSVNFINSFEHKFYKNETDQEFNKLD